MPAVVILKDLLWGFVLEGSSGWNESCYTGPYRISTLEENDHLEYSFKVKKMRITPFPNGCSNVSQTGGPRHSGALQGS